MHLCFVICYTVIGPKLGIYRKQPLYFFGDSGLEKVAIEGEEKNELMVIGEGIDVAKLVTILRKKVGFADVVSVDLVDKKKEEEPINSDLIIKAEVMGTTELVNAKDSIEQGILMMNWSGWRNEPEINSCMRKGTPFTAQTCSSKRYPYHSGSRIMVALDFENIIQSHYVKNQALIAWRAWDRTWRERFEPTIEQTRVWKIAWSLEDLRTLEFGPPLLVHYFGSLH
ncbi:putative subtilisin-like protease [Capsicum annuum]|nr:putative subtilisin-like protease [Capsicum annuum]KAF3654202.1 putative subtilisin-like protease [Capsicum annuum]